MSAPSADMICGRPSSCRASYVSTVTLVRPSLLQSASEPPALDLPPVSKHDARFVWWTLTFSSENWHYTPSCTLGNVYTNFDFSTFLFSSFDPVRDRRTDRQTDGQTDGPTGGPDNKAPWVRKGHYKIFVITPSDIDRLKFLRWQTLW